MERYLYLISNANNYCNRREFDKSAEYTLL
jgi:hypothetical protein